MIVILSEAKNLIAHQGDSSLPLRVTVEIL
jgi:hypothetical protein